MFVFLLAGEEIHFQVRVFRPKKLSDDPRRKTEIGNRRRDSG